LKDCLALESKGDDDLAERGTVEKKSSAAAVEEDELRIRGEERVEE